MNTTKFSVTRSGFANTTGLEVFVKGTKKNKKPHGAIYLERGQHPDGEVDLKHTTGSDKCKGKSKANMPKECLKFDGEAQIKLTRAEGAGLTYEPAQIHFHAPSEHTIDGKYYDFEFHMVMAPSGATKVAADKFLKAQKAKMGDANFQVNYAVLGLMFYATDCTLPTDEKDCKKMLALTDSFFKPMEIEKIWKNKGSKKWGNFKEYTKSIAGEVPLKDLIDAVDTSSFFSYEGSLTTPPCAEGIRWTVLRKALPINKKTMAMIHKNYKGDKTYGNGNGNNRAIQKLNNRTVLIQGAVKTMATSVAAASILYALF